MRLINHVDMRRKYEAAVRDKTPERFFMDFTEALREGHVKPEELSVRRLFEEFVDNGRELVKTFDPRQVNEGYNIPFLEDAGYVNTSAFSSIMGQINYTVVLEQFSKPELLFDSVCTVVPTSFDGEKIPGVGAIGDRAEAIPEGGGYPHAGLSQEWIETPQTTKRGFIIGLSKETLFFDRTNLINERAAEVGEWLAINREKRALDVVFGIVNPYKRNGVSINTYNTSTPFDNVAASNALVDYTDVEAALLTFDAMVDPNTGEPIMVDVNTMIVPSALRFTAKRVLNATEIRLGDGASATVQTISANPIDRQMTVLSNQYVKSRTSSDSTWFIGDPKRAFKYMQNWGPTVVPAPSNSEVEFTHDIVSRWKVSERGAMAVVEPRRMVKCTQ